MANFGEWRTHLPSANRSSMMACRSGGISFKPACAWGASTGNLIDGCFKIYCNDTMPYHTAPDQTGPHYRLMQCKLSIYV